MRGILGDGESVRPEGGGEREREREVKVERESGR